MQNNKLGRPLIPGPTAPLVQTHALLGFWIRPNLSCSTDSIPIIATRSCTVYVKPLTSSDNCSICKASISMVSLSVILFSFLTLHTQANTSSRVCQVLSLKKCDIFATMASKSYRRSANFNHNTFTFFRTFLLLGNNWVYLGYYGLFFPHINSVC